MILPMSKQMKLLYIESCKQVAADATGCKKGFRKKFRICNIFSRKSDSRIAVTSVDMLKRVWIC